MNPKPIINYTIRRATLEDKAGIKALYQAVAKIPGGIARTFEEITDDYITRFLTNSLNTGLIFVAEYNGQIIGSLHTYALGPKVFAHILGETTICVHPDFQGIGIGGKIIKALQQEVAENCPTILRVELIVRESNVRAFELYKKLGFIQEGRLERRIRGITGTLEADIPMAWFNPNFRKQQ